MFIPNSKLKRVPITKKEITSIENQTRLVGKQCSKITLKYTKLNLFPSPGQKRFLGRKHQANTSVVANVSGTFPTISTHIFLQVSGGHLHYFKEVHETSIFKIKKTQF